MSYIENLFVKKANEKIETYRCLIAHWDQVKLHIPKVLSCITLVFPHYTLHDVSHSEEILNSIKRVLGEETLELLSVTDLWMILCAAYCHDVGMFISGEELKKIFDDEKFIQYLTGIDNTSELYDYAKCFKRDENIRNTN